METMISDEWREGYAAFQCGAEINPYDWKDMDGKYDDWEDGWLAAQLNWFELVGA